jgi:acyl transferase domain-containing protein
MANKKRALVVFPGRGSYAAGELGYLERHHAARADLVGALDDARSLAGAQPTRELDSLPKFSPSKHLPGRNASNLIYTCAQADFAAINREAFEIVAICGNSLGWYLALAASQALSLKNGAKLVDTMGHLMEQKGVGGQLLCPIAAENWRIDSAFREQVFAAIARTPDAFLSIDLAGTLVLAGSDAAVTALQKELRAPDGSKLVQLPKHAAFHTPLLEHVAQEARQLMTPALFGSPAAPLIDGRGHIWSPFSCDAQELYRYTLGHQIVEPYDFAKSVEVAMKEFAPDCIILAGPGSTLGAPIAQSLIACNWQDIADRQAFMDQQGQEPILLSMGREDQRKLVCQD